MRSLKYLLISLVSLLSVNDLFACWDPWYAPGGYYMYRVYDNTRKPTSTIDVYNPGAGRNCEAWQKLTSKTIPLEEIYEVVYKMSLEEFETIYDSREISYKNRFAEWITKKDTAALNFLLLAKNNEYIRSKRNSRWYYPSMKIDARMTIEEIAEKALSADDGRLRDRYLLQGVRALFSLAKYEDCISLWGKEISKLPKENLMRQLIQPYIAGAEFRVKHSEKAIEHFAQLGDVKSILFCAGRTGENLSVVDALELICKYAPNSKSIEETLQSYIRKMEFCREEETDETFEEEKLGELCLEMARGDRSDNPAMWYYTAAFLEDMSGNTTKASYLLGQAEKSQSSDYIDESVKVFRIYLDAKQLPYNASYEKRLFGQLKWLDSKIKAGIDDNVRNETALGNKLVKCESYYYWNDMMRRILLAEVCPGMLKAGKTTRALQLANMADNRLFSLVNRQDIYDWVEENDQYEYKMVGTYTMQDYRYSANFNRYDYSNHFFEMIDSVGVDRAIEYVQRVNRPQGEFDRFLNSRGYTAKDYLNDIIGTQCLRNMRYEEAASYLGTVGKAYKNHLNVYMEYDPFSVERMAVKQKKEFRYDFARQMCSLERDINLTTDPNKRARLMIKYAVGLRNSFDLCWGLTQYYRGVSYWGEVCEKRDWENDEYTKAAMKRVKELADLACEIVTDDETAANLQYMLCNYRTVAKKYPNTAKGELVRGKCDNLYDYHAESHRSR